MWDPDSDVLTFISIIQDDVLALGRERVIHLGYAPGATISGKSIFGCTTLAESDPTTPTLPWSATWTQNEERHLGLVYVLQLL